MPQPKIHNAMELEALAQQMGFLPFFSCTIPNFSIEEFTPSCYWFVEGVDGPWEWRMDLARRGVLAYGKLFAKKAGLLSREWYPDLVLHQGRKLQLSLGWISAWLRCRFWGHQPTNVIRLIPRKSHSKFNL